MHYNQKNKQTGFTIIELMLVILVGGIIMAIAIPNFRSMQRSNCMTTSTNQMIVSLNLARSEAAKFNDNINLTAASGGNATNEWGAGWIVWRDVDNDNTQDADEIIYRNDIDCGSLTVNDTGNNTTYVYRSDGFINNAATLEVCDPNVTGERGRQINVSVTGRPSVNSQFTCT